MLEQQKFGPEKHEAKLEKFSAATEKDKVIISMESSDFVIGIKVFVLNNFKIILTNLIHILMQAKHEELVKAFNFMKNKYEATKNVAGSRHTRITELERLVNKENLSNNRSALSHVSDPKSLNCDVSLLKKQVSELETKCERRSTSEANVTKKYNQSKQLCKLRLADIKKLEKKIKKIEQQIVQLFEIIVQLQSKYAQEED